MSEFKGTKSKWDIFRQDNDIYIETESGNAAICSIVGGVGLEQDEANALLISKALKMLEMLKIARDKFLDLKHDKNLPELQEIQDQIEQLIKEATQIK